MVSIVGATCDFARRFGVKTVGLLGTRFTMQSDYYPKEFEKYGMSLVPPNADEIEYIQLKLFSEIELGIIKEETRTGLLDIISRIRKDDRIEGVILGCTELPLILSQKDMDILCLNTTKIHIDALVERCKD